MGACGAGMCLLNPGKTGFAVILGFCFGVCGLSWSPEVKRTYIWTAQCHITGRPCYSAPRQVHCLWVLWVSVDTSIYISVGNLLITHPGKRHIEGNWQTFSAFEFKWQAERCHLFTCNWTEKGPAERVALQLVFQNIGWPLHFWPPQMWWDSYLLRSL